MSSTPAQNQEGHPCPRRVSTFPIQRNLRLAEVPGPNDPSLGRSFRQPEKIQLLQLDLRFATAEFHPAIDLNLLADVFLPLIN